MRKTKCNALFSCLDDTCGGLNAFNVICIFYFFPPSQLFFYFASVVLLSCMRVGIKELFFFLIYFFACLLPAFKKILFWNLDKENTQIMKNDFTDNKHWVCTGSNHTVLGGGSVSCKCRIQPPLPGRLGMALEHAIRQRVPFCQLTKEVTILCDF